MSELSRINQYAAVIAAFWTFAACASMLWGFQLQRNGIITLAKSQARAAFQKDILYRKWSADRGGVYIRANEATPPNPYIPENAREIETSGGEKLTLVNPAYMTRQVHEMGTDENGVFGHITSLNPIRPENAPDEWETEALKLFEIGEKEAVTAVKTGDGGALRFMRPLTVEAGCLKCHASQGYKLGEIRGGISVMVPLKPLKESVRSHLTAIAAGHSALWLFGIVAIASGARTIRRETKQRLKDEAALKASEEFLKKSQEIAHVGSWSLDLSDNSITWSDEVFRIFGLEPGNIAPTFDAFLELVHPEDRGQISEAYEKAIKSHELTEIVHRIITPAKRTRTVRQKAFMADAVGGGARIVGTVHDITEQQVYEESLKMSRKLWEDTFNAITDVVLVIDREFKILKANRIAEDMFGSDRIVGAKCHELFHGQDSPRPWCPALSVSDTKESRRVQMKEEYLGGRWFDYSAHPISDEVGNVTQIVLVARDITEKKRAEEEAARTASLNELLLDSFPHPAMLIDKNKKILAANRIAKKMGAAQGESCWSSFAGMARAPGNGDAGKGVAALSACSHHCDFCLAEKAFADMESKQDSNVGLKGGIWDTHWVPVDENTYLHYAVDISEIRKAEEALRKSERDLAIRNRIADVFLARSSGDDMFAETLEVVRKELGSEYGYFGYIDEKGDFVSASMTREVWDVCQIPEKTNVFPKDCWNGLWGRSLIGKRTIFSNEPLKVPQGHVPLDRAVAAPIVYSGKLIGQLALANKKDDYTDNDIRLIDSITEYIAPILHFKLTAEREERDRRKAETAIRSIIEGTAATTGKDFFRSLAKNLAQALSVKYALIAEYPADAPGKARSLSFWAGNGFADDFEYDLTGTPCAEVLESGKDICYFPKSVRELFPDDVDLAKMGAESYLGTLMMDSAGKRIGHVAVLDDKQMAFDPDTRRILKVFAARAQAEIERLGAEEQLKRHRDRLEEIVAEKTVELEKANQAVFQTMKYQMVARLSMGLSHEIKNPLAIMKTHAELLETNEAVANIGDEEISYSLSVLLKQIDRISTTLDNLRILSREKASEFKNIEIKSMIGEVIKMFYPALRKAGITARQSYAEDAPSIIEADETKLMQMLTNLVFNAMESMSERGGKLTLSLDSLESGRLVQISVSDTGRGISKDNIKKVFDPFFTTKSGGTGMGLAICAGMAEDHGGSISVESAEGEGATFRLTLPASQSATKRNGEKA
ncbi:MAG TPA: DUF3365 domain-containing protein [bacterium]|nr:DUF3365 domain-containing protein [bacterium]